jgi:hypothetical protein
MLIHNIHNDNGEWYDKIKRGLCIPPLFYALLLTSDFLSLSQALLFHYKTEHTFLFINKFIYNINIKERMKNERILP